jgi:hypothetical protein
MNAVVRPIRNRRVRRQAVSRYEYYGPSGFGSDDDADVLAASGEAEAIVQIRQRSASTPRRRRAPARNRSLLFVLCFLLFLMASVMSENDLVTTEGVGIIVTPVDHGAGVHPAAWRAL